MIVRQFLQWLRSAPAGDRAEATSALARAYLYSQLSPDDRAAAEGAMTMLLDDPSPLVRRALAETLSAHPGAPAPIIFALSCDQPEIAGLVLERSPLLLDSDLVEAVASGGAAAQLAIARRTGLPRSVAAAIAEIGAPEACLVLLENPFAEIAFVSMDRIVARFGELAAIRETLLMRDDLPRSTRQALVAKLSETLADFVASRDWLAFDRARRVAKEACEKATVIIAAETPQTEMSRLIGHLRESGQLTAGLILRALLSGNVALFEHALADLSGFPLSRVSRIVHDGGRAGFRGLYEKAGLPASTYPAFREAVTSLQEDGVQDEFGGATRLKRRMIERVLTACENELPQDIEPLVTLLRRFAAEAAREEARLFCDELVDGLLPDLGTRLVAA